MISRRYWIVLSSTFGGNRPASAALAALPDFGLVSFAVVRVWFSFSGCSSSFWRCWSFMLRILSRWARNTDRLRSTSSAPGTFVSFSARSLCKLKKKTFRYVSRVYKFCGSFIWWEDYLFQLLLALLACPPWIVLNFLRVDWLAN